MCWLRSHKQMARYSTGPHQIDESIDKTDRFYYLICLLVSLISGYSGDLKPLFFWRAVS